MAKIEGVTKKRASWLTRLVYWIVQRKVGKLLEPTTLMAHSPGVMWGSSMMEGCLLTAKKLDAGVKELAQIKVAMMIGCPF